MKNSVWIVCCDSKWIHFCLKLSLDVNAGWTFILIWRSILHLMFFILDKAHKQQTNHWSQCCESCMTISTHIPRGQSYYIMRHMHYTKSWQQWQQQKQRKRQTCVSIGWPFGTSVSDTKENNKFQVSEWHSDLHTWPMKSMSRYEFEREATASNKTVRQNSPESCSAIRLTFVGLSHVVLWFPQAPHMG